jgi:hypothetical protein
MHLNKEFYLLRLAPVCSRTLIRAPIPRWLVIACKSLTWAALLLNQSVSARSEPDFHSLWPDLWSCISSRFHKLLLGTTAGRWIHLRLHFVAGIFVFSFQVAPLHPPGDGNHVLSFFIRSGGGIWLHTARMDRRNWKMLRVCGMLIVLLRFMAHLLQPPQNLIKVFFIRNEVCTVIIPS